MKYIPLAELGEREATAPQVRSGHSWKGKKAVSVLENNNVVKLLGKRTTKCTLSLKQKKPPSWGLLQNLTFICSPSTSISVVIC